MHIGPDGKVVGDQDGSAGAFGVTEAQHMAAGLSDLRADLHADLRDVLGDEVLLYLPGKDDQGLLVALNPEAAQVSAVLSADLDLALQLWRRRGGP